MKSASSTEEVYSAAEYEDGWWVEKPHPTKPIEECVFVQAQGPFKNKETAEKWARKLNGH